AAGQQQYEARQQPFLPGLIDLCCHHDFIRAEAFYKYTLFKHRKSRQRVPFIHKGVKVYLKPPGTGFFLNRHQFIIGYLWCNQ
ncbi:MAG TPA: hypothetical protein PK133_12505, partial [Ferruginibacter sp.]|nr:hypothetical protein [Ferruginibacter sp.]